MEKDSFSIPFTIPFIPIPVSFPLKYPTEPELRFLGIGIVPPLVTIAFILDDFAAAAAPSKVPQYGDSRNLGWIREEKERNDRPPNAMIEENRFRDCGGI